MIYKHRSDHSADDLAVYIAEALGSARLRKVYAQKTGQSSQTFLDQISGPELTRTARADTHNLAGAPVTNFAGERERLEFLARADNPDDESYASCHVGGNEEPSS
jgi:hypothetical protein